MNLAPIGISTYKRLSHLKKTMKALENNYLADKSDVFIFSDAPRAGDEIDVYELRKYLKNQKWNFRNFKIIEREENGRVRNARGGIETVLNENGKIIFIEEDIVSSRNFIRFMNCALDYYKDNNNILSISGYCPPINIPNGYEYDTFFLKRASSWGLGLWKKWYDNIEMEYKGFDEILESKENKIELSIYGDDLYGKILKDYNGEIDGLDIKMFYTQFKKSLYTVYPVKSLTKNIGFDGSGIHCGVSNKFDVDLDKTNRRNFNFSSVINDNKDIIASNYEFRKNNRIKTFIKKILKILKIYNYFIFLYNKK